MMDSLLKKEFAVQAFPNRGPKVTHRINPVNPLQTDNTPKDEKADIVTTTSAADSELKLKIDVHLKGTVTPQTVFRTLKAAKQWLPLIVQLLQLMNPIPSAQPNFPPTQPEIAQPEIIQPILTDPADRDLL